ncbi:MAG: hypothetical protein ACI8PT_000814 [Gammaproteobacteria bacterium]|jgi:hypothetical protein
MYRCRCGRLALVADLRCRRWRTISLFPGHIDQGLIFSLGIVGTCAGQARLAHALAAPFVER